MPFLSQNGFVANDRSHIRSATIAGTDVKVAVRRGAAGDLLLYVAARWHREVEPLRAADGVLDCWGYAERTIRGSATTLSNHASGTALDFRARIHPLGKAGTYSATQRVAIRRILADCRGAVRWGGDYAGRKDEMHAEVTATEAACARVLAGLTAIDHPARPTLAPVAKPALPPLSEEDDVDVPIRPDQSGDFRTAVKVEAGAGTATGYTAAYVSLTPAWGGVNFLVTCHGNTGPLWQWNAGSNPDQSSKRLHLGENEHWVQKLPEGTRTVAIEGNASRDAAVAAAIWHVR